MNANAVALLFSVLYVVPGLMAYMFLGTSIERLRRFSTSTGHPALVVGQTIQHSQNVVLPILPLRQSFRPAAVICCAYFQYRQTS